MFTIWNVIELCFLGVALPLTPILVGFLLYRAQKYFNHILQKKLITHAWFPVVHYALFFFTVLQVIILIDEHKHIYLVGQHFYWIYRINPYSLPYHISSSWVLERYDFLIPSIVMFGYTWWLKSVLGRKATKNNKKNNRSK